MAEDKGYKLVQFRVSEKDEILTDLISSLEKEAQGRRGYVAEKLRDRLRAFEILSEYTGETDPYKIMMLLASKKEDSPRQEEPPAPKEEKPKKKVSSMALLNSIANME